MGANANREIGIPRGTRAAGWREEIPLSAWDWEWQGERKGSREILHCATAVPQERDGEKTGRHSVLNDAAGVLAAGDGA